MPAQVKKSVLSRFNKTELGKAHAETAAKPPELGNRRLPSGIENGIARVVLMKYGEVKQGAKKNAGEPIFTAQAVILSPKEFTDKAGNNHKVEGLRTSINLVIADRPAENGVPAETWQTRFQKSQDVLKMFAPDMVKNIARNADGTIKEEDAYDKVCEAIVRAKPCVNFRTWSMDKDEIVKLPSGKFQLGTRAGRPVYNTEMELKAKNPYWNSAPLVNEQWQGMCDPPESSGEDEGDDDLTGGPTDQAPSANGEAHNEVGNTNADGALSDIAQAAQDGDEAAVAQLEQLAKDAGVDMDAFAAADNYLDTLPLFEAASAGTTDGTTEETAEEPAPKPEPEAPAHKKGDAVKFKPVDPRDKKKHLKAIDCVIEKVDGDKLTLKNLKDKKTFTIKADDKGLS